jgi:HTH-type transcriptional regulator / antitoxin MqsA
MRCPACNESEMEERTVDKILSYGGCSITLSEMKGQFCPTCGDGVWNPESYSRYTKAQSDLVHVRNDIGINIRRIRKKLNLSQNDLATILGFGRLTFARYEKGKSRPPAAVVKLLKLIDDDPKLLEKIKDMNISCDVMARTEDNG